MLLKLELKQKKIIGIPDKHVVMCVQNLFVPKSVVNEVQKMDRLYCVFTLSLFKRIETYWKYADRIYLIFKHKFRLIPLTNIGILSDLQV